MEFYRYQCLVKIPSGFNRDLILELGHK